MMRRATIEVAPAPAECGVRITVLAEAPTAERCLTIEWPAHQYTKTWLVRPR